MTVHFGAIDLGLILLYMGGVVFLGYRASRARKTDADEFLLAGRTLTLPLFVATLVSTWYGGILGVGEFSYRYGLSNWFVFGLPYYFFALLFALFLARRIRATNLYTIPDKLEQSFGRPTALLGGVLAFILATPAAYVLMLGVLVQVVFGGHLAIWVTAATVLTTIYLYKGGFRSDVWVNTFEFVLMFLGFALIVVFAAVRYGGVTFIEAHVPPQHLTWRGGNSWQYILVWFFIALWTLIDPAFHQRCYAARDEATAQRGILVSIGFWFVFDALTTTAGLYARAALPDLSQPMYSYPALAEVLLPPVAKGLFYIGMLATIMSTLSSLTLISAITIGKDVVGRLARPDRREELTARWTRYGLTIAAAFSVLLALAVPSVVGLWYTIGTCVIPGLLVPILASYFRSLRIPPAHAFAAMLTGWLVSTASFVAGRFLMIDGVPHYPLGIEPMYPGLTASIVIWGVGRFSELRGLKSGGTHGRADGA